MKQKPLSAAGRFWLPGSYTVEASLLLSVILIVLIVVLNLSLFLTDSVRMTAVLAESAQCFAQGQEDTPLDSCSFFRLHPEAVRVKKGRNRVTLTVQDQPEPRVLNETYEASFTVQKRHPVSWLWKIRLLQMAAE